MKTTQDIAIRDSQADFFQPVDIPKSFKKSVGVVQVDMGGLGFLHRKVLNVLVANAQEGLALGHKRSRIEIGDLTRLAHCNTNNYQAIYDVCEELRATPVRTISFDNKSGDKKARRKVTGMGLLAEFSIIEGGTLEYEFSTQWAKVLLDPFNYIWMSVAIQGKFNSKYELALYENTIRYVRAGSTGFKDVEQWREILGATDPLYDQFKHLNDRVIKKSVKVVSDVSPVTVTPEYKRVKRKVSQIRMLVEPKAQQSIFDYEAHQTMRETTAYKEAVKLGLAEVEIFYWLEKKGETYVQEAIDYVKSSKKKVDKPAGYLVSAMEEGWGEKSPAERKKEADLEQARKEAAAAKERAAKQEALESAFETHQTKRTIEIIQALTGEDKAHVTELVEAGEMVPTLAKPWRNQIDRDLSRVGELPSKLGVWVASRCKVPVLEKWGEPRDRDFEEFAKSMTK